MSRLVNSLVNLIAISSAENPSIRPRGINSNADIASTSNATRTLATMTNGYGSSDKEKKPNEAAAIIRRTNIVCFDVDSTVIREEGIDELAAFCGKRNEVSRLTREAMQGSMTFQEALRKRLEIINPSQGEIWEFIKTHPSTLSSGLKDFIGYLREHNVEVFLVSGGFDCLIEPVAEQLGIPVENIYANKLFFTYKGDYAGFDTNQPTSRSGGKAEAIAKIKARANETDIITMIGDGATDLEACPPADYFIGYGGNVVREEVRNRSTYYVTNFSQLIAKSH
ncbi:phosphoserine phosphatase isoform X1 [Lutzomyia longipalpis]|uniref:phosphoserine phosphatase isoform X1 n=2 Tax=Lutzomyia longipalpis TaxID=7200 RepID=UPI0024836E34|nr:phosphoserine phosphatase isoform X1 [Lutzomyia longipalpis]